jgi:hypothetical protein
MRRRRPAKARGNLLPRSSAYLTSSGDRDLDRALGQTYAGQAHLAIGPEHCSTCAFLGYWRQHTNAAGNIVGPRERRSGCLRFFELTGQHGPNVPGTALACRHYRKPEA